MKYLLTSALLFLSLHITAGGGWVYEKGKGFVKINQSAILANQYFSPSGNIIDITTTALYTSSIYAEWGISNRLTGIVYFPFFSRATLNNRAYPSGEIISEGDQLNAMGDTDISLKYGLIQNGPVVLSTTLTLGLPIGNSSGGRTQLLQTGDGEFNQMITVEASHSFYPKQWYATGLLAFNNRTRGFSDEIRYGLEAGYHPGKWLLVLRLLGVKPLLNDNNEQLPVNGLFNNRVEYFSITPEINYQLKERLGLSFSAAGALYGKNILAAPTFSVGAYLKFD